MSDKVRTSSVGDYLDVDSGGTINVLAGGVFNAQAGSRVVIETGIVVSADPGTGIKFNSDAPAFGWRDITATVQPKAIGTGSPVRAAYAGANLAQYAFVANDVCEFEVHLPHDYVPGSDLYFHVHWSHTGTTITGNATFEAYYTFAKGHDQATFPAEKTLTLTRSTVDVATTPRYMHLIDEVPMTAHAASATLTAHDDIEVDGLILVTLKLTAIPTMGGSGKLFVHTADIHYQSTNVATKNRAPGFYE
jgi:hypothetical protein